jgi:hypothetical protein
VATVFTDAGKAIVTNLMKAAGTEPKWIGHGTGAGTAAAADTTLFTEVVDTARAVGVSSRVTTTVTNDTYRVVGTLTATTARAITNAGTFDALTTGNMGVKGDFSVINLATGDSIQYTVDLKFA